MQLHLCFQNHLFLKIDLYILLIGKNKCFKSFYKLLRNLYQRYITCEKRCFIDVFKEKNESCQFYKICANFKWCIAVFIRKLDVKKSFLNLEKDLIKF